MLFLRLDGTTLDFATPIRPYGEVFNKMRKSRIFNHLLGTFFVCHLAPAQGRPIIEESSNFKINWFDLKASAHEVVPPAQSPTGQSFKSAELQARHKARNALLENFKSLLSAKTNGSQAPETKAILASNASQALNSVNTIYNSDGSVRVEYEAHLGRLINTDSLGSQGSGSDDLELQPATNSGLLIQLKGEMAPRAIYEIVSSNGDILFSHKLVNHKILKKKLMGRWAQNASAGEISKALGNKPITLEATAGKPGQMIVDETQWRLATGTNPQLLLKANILISTQ